MELGGYKRAAESGRRFIEPGGSRRMPDDQHPAESRRAEARNDPGRHESEEEREDRNLMELLQELRVAGIGIQVLFGFLLSLPFTVRFGSLDALQRHLFIVTLVLAAVATGLLSAPVAYHRLVFRQHKKARLLRVANGLALAGIAVVGLAISSAVLLVTGVVLRGIAVPLISASVSGMFFVLWFLVPLISGRFGDRDQT
jgi:Family of unknown function (DUF6328)